MLRTEKTQPNMKRKDADPKAPNVPSRAALDLINTLDYRELHHWNSLALQYEHISAEKLVEKFNNSRPGRRTALVEDWEYSSSSAEEGSDFKEKPSTNPRNLISHILASNRIRKTWRLGSRNLAAKKKCH